MIGRSYLNRPHIPFWKEDDAIQIRRAEGRKYKGPELEKYEESINKMSEDNLREADDAEGITRNPVTTPLLNKNVCDDTCLSLDSVREKTTSDGKDIEKHREP